MGCPLHHGCSHTREGLRQQIPRRHTQGAPRVVYTHSDNCRKGPHHLVLPQAQPTGSPTAPQGESLPCYRTACTWVRLSNHWPSHVLWHQAPRLCPATCCPIHDEQPTKKIWPGTRPSQCDSPAERPRMGWRRHSSQRIKIYHDAQDTDLSRCRWRGFEAPILQGQPAFCFAEQAVAHQVQIYHPWPLLLTAHHQGLEPPSPSSEDCILTRRVQGGPSSVTTHQRLFLSCTSVYPAPEFLNVLWAVTNRGCFLSCLSGQHTTSSTGCQVGDSWLRTWTWTWTSKVVVISYAWLQPGSQGFRPFGVQWRKPPTQKS